MVTSNTWQEFFDAHAPIYDENVFTRNTVQEVSFLREELELRPGGSIIDVACGTGRHAIELAKRGYAVTGLDLSTGMLARASTAAKAAGVQVEWLRADATQFSLPRKYDAAICLCEGAFGLLSQADDPVEQPLSILRNISRCLKPGARAVFTVLNAARMIRRYQNRESSQGRFDSLTMVESSTVPPREGLPPLPLRERGFLPSELVLLFRLAGMPPLDIWGGTAGNWRRAAIDPDEFEIMVVARKAGEPWPDGTI